MATYDLENHGINEIFPVEHLHLQQQLLTAVFLYTESHNERL